MNKSLHFCSWVFDKIFRPRYRRKKQLNDLSSNDILEAFEQYLHRRPLFEMRKNKKRKLVESHFNSEWRENDQTSQTNRLSSSFFFVYFQSSFVWFSTKKLTAILRCKSEFDRLIVSEFDSFFQIARKLSTNRLFRFCSLFFKYSKLFSSPQIQFSSNVYLTSFS